MYGTFLKTLCLFLVFPPLVTCQTLNKPDVFPFKGIELTRPVAQMERQDIIWLAEKIVISTPLRSYGGNIILFADEIEIDAPIDSRLYIDHAKEQRFIPGNPTPMTQMIQRPSVMHTMFENYFTTGLEMQGPDRITGVLPVLPDGLIQPNTAKWAFLPKDVQPGWGSPPGYTVQQLQYARSGNIYIFAHEIKIGATTFAVRSIADDEDCAANPNLGEPKLIVSAGARGGKGGLGTPAACFMPVQEPDMGNGTDRQMMQVSYPYICNRDESAAGRTLEGGPSASGATGADGGDTTVYIVNNPSQLTRFQTELKPVSDVGGGPRGLRTMFRTPSWEGTNKVTASRCSLIKVGVSPYNDVGKPGVLSVQPLNANQALDTLLFLTMALTAKPEQDVTVIAQTAFAQDSSQTLTASDSLYNFLNDVVGSSRVDLQACKLEYSIVSPK